MKKAYVILKKGFEYDDNIYSEFDTDGGVPKLIIYDKKTALAKVLELNIEEYKKVCITEYGYNINDVIKVDENVYNDFNKSLVEKYGIIKTQYSWESHDRLHPMADDNESKQYAKMINLDFYHFVQTDIDVQSYRDTKINSILE